MRICQVKKPPGGRRRGTATEERRERKPEGIRDLNATKGGKCKTPISVLNPSRSNCCGTTRCGWNNPAELRTPTSGLGVLHFPPKVKRLDKCGRVLYPRI